MPRSRTRSQRRRIRQERVQDALSPAPCSIRSTVRVLDYNQDGVREFIDPSDQRLAAFPSSATITWIDLDAVCDVEDIARISKLYDVHPLWVEDLCNPHTRPKVEQHGDRALVILRVLTPPTATDSAIGVEQVGIAFGAGFVLSFQQHPGDLWDGVRGRLMNREDHLRTLGSDRLMHALIDSVVDGYFDVLRHFEDRADDLEDIALSGIDTDLLETIAATKSELATVRSAVWPLREAVATILRVGEGIVARDTIPFIRDVDDHLHQVMDMVETTRDRVFASLQLHLAVTGQRTNEIMRFLTVMSAIFMPMTFLAGVWGMNFTYMPELGWTFGYALALGLMAMTGGGLIAWFRRKGWL